ncbi:MAG: transposase [Candidatus Nealsonbacteria bacterium]
MELHHSFNRGTEKRNIFLDQDDYFRGVHDLYAFNDVNAIVNFGQRFKGSPTPFIGNKPREKLVEVISWCLMPNHYHLFSYSIVENGFSKFHQKFGGGFTNFFNVKYKRNGVLFQGKYKKVRVVDDAQVIQLICYIHSNPLNVWKPNWKENGLTDMEIQNALEFLEKKYRWSSHLDYWGTKNFPSLIDNNFSLRFFKNPEEYREIFTNWLKYYSRDIQSIEKLALE